MSPFPEYQRYTIGTCVHCNHMVTIDIGLDAHMHDCVEFECPSCGKPTSVIITVRGIEPGIFRGRGQHHAQVVKGRIREIDPPAE